MKEHWKKAPEGSTISGHRTKNYVYYTLLRGILSSFIDYDKAECHYDSDEFIHILDFLDSFDDYTDTKEEIDFMSPAFLNNCIIDGFKSFHSLFYSTSVDDINFIGYPSNDKSGSYFGGPLNQVAICASSSAEKQKGAWMYHICLNGNIIHNLSISLILIHQMLRICKECLPIGIMFQIRLI